jgi:hypothetical protein
VLVNPGNPAQGVDGSSESNFSPPAAVVAEDAAGDFVVVWSNTPASGRSAGLTDIYAQRFSPVGVPIGSVIAVATGTTPSNIYPHPAVAMDAKGDFVVAFDSDNGVFVERYAASGAALDSSPLQVSSFGSTPEVALDDQGEFIVTYNSYTDTGEGVFACRGFMSGPNPLDPNGSFTVASAPFSASVFYQAEAIGTDATGDFVIAYEPVSFVSAALSSIDAQRVDAGGNLLGSPIALSTSGVAVSPWVAVNRSNGNFAVSWVENTQNPSFVAETFTVNGSPIAGPFNISPASQPPASQGYDSPGIAADSNGNFVAVWAVHSASAAVPQGIGVTPDDPPSDNDPTGNILVQQFNSAGVLTGSLIELTASPNAPGPLGVAKEPTGEFVAAFSNSRQTVATPSGPSATGNSYDIIADIFRYPTVTVPPPVAPPPATPPVVARTLDPSISIALSQEQQQEENERFEEIPIIPPLPASDLNTVVLLQTAAVPVHDDPAAVLIQQVGGTQAHGSISGRLFADLTGDGVFSQDKPPLAGRLVFLDLNNNGQLDEGEPVSITNSNGEYSFTGLTFQTYQVRQLLVRGDSQTLPTDNGAWEVHLDNSRHDASGRNFGNLNSPLRVNPRPAPAGSDRPAAPVVTPPSELDNSEDDPDD